MTDLSVILVRVRTAAWPADACCAEQANGETHLDSPHAYGPVVRVFYGCRCYLNLFDQFALVSIDGIQPVNHMVFVDVIRK